MFSIIDHNHNNFDLICFRPVNYLNGGLIEDRCFASPLTCTQTRLICPSTYSGVIAELVEQSNLTNRIWTIFDGNWTNFSYFPIHRNLHVKALLFLRFWGQHMVVLVFINDTVGVTKLRVWWDHATPIQWALDADIWRSCAGSVTNLFPTKLHVPRVLPSTRVWVCK